MPMIIFVDIIQRFVAYSPIILCLIFILWRSVRKTTIILGMKKITIVVDNIPLTWQVIVV
jgi:hypothetical protein